MHPPLTILDQTDELIAIEWLREHGFNEYAEYMEHASNHPFNIYSTTADGNTQAASWSWSKKRCSSETYSGEWCRSWSESRRMFRCNSGYGSTSKSKSRFRFRSET